MKENPLFVDSTKTRGDNIKVNFELSNLLLRDDERLILKVIEEPQGRQHEVLMRSQDNLYTARLFLQHQNKIKFQFVVLKDDKVELVSPAFDDRAHYIIESLWDVARSKQLIFDKKSQTENKDHRVYQQFQENKTLLGNLIKQWGL